MARLGNRYPVFWEHSKHEDVLISGQQKNNTSGITGVHWNKQKGKWRAVAKDNNGRYKYLGYFSDIHEAATVVQNFRKNPELGYSARHGGIV